MKKVNLNELAALQLAVPELLTAAMNDFSKGTSIKDKENADLCYKALESFLKKGTPELDSSGVGSPIISLSSGFFSGNPHKKFLENFPKTLDKSKEI